MLGLSVLGSVPAMSRRQKIQTRGRRVFLQPDSHEAEAFRTIRTAIFFGAPKDNVRTFLITSPAAGDGKSTLVSNLGIAMASAGQKTLVLDADLRRPTQHVIFETDHVDRCLDSVLKGRISLRMAIKDTEVKGLSLLSCGQGFSNPAEILNSPQFTKLLEHLSRAYDRILIDAPPVTVVTDAQILGALCDRTILVVKADNTTRRMAQRAVNALRSVNAQLLGVVVNSVGGSDGYYGYYRRYGRLYGSGSNGEGSRVGRVDGTSKGPTSRVSVIAKDTRYED
jgi:capsular exopolysaccharide synthesis family protein